MSAGAGRDRCLEGGVAWSRVGGRNNSAQKDSRVARRYIGVDGEN